MSHLTIGLVLPSVPGYSETFFRSKIKGLQERGHKVLLFTGSSQNDSGHGLSCKIYNSPNLSGYALKRGIVSSITLLKLLLTTPAKSLKLFRQHRHKGDDIEASLRSLIINSHILPHKLDWLHFGFATMGVGRELLGRAIGAKVAVSFRGYDISIYPLKHQGIYNRLWSNIDKVHTISDDLLHRAYELGLPPHLPVEKITPAIKADDFARIGTMADSIHHPIRILTVGRMHWKKGGELMLDALALLKQNDIVFEFTWVGDGPERERLCHAAHQHQLEDSVHFPGNLPHQQIPRLMNKHDIYLQYSIQEGFCNAVLEAQASGMLCLVSDAEGLSENVLHKRTGWVVPKCNPGALAQKIEEVLLLPEVEKEKIRRQASERIQREFDLKKQERAFVDFYRS